MILLLNAANISPAVLRPRLNAKICEILPLFYLFFLLDLSTIYSFEIQHGFTTIKIFRDIWQCAPGFLNMSTPNCLQQTLISSMTFSTFLKIIRAGQMVQLITSSSLHCPVFCQVIFFYIALFTHCFIENHAVKVYNIFRSSCLLLVVTFTYLYIQLYIKSSAVI